jgi:parvulin-like peptidyl-prolyl isomerase
VQAARTARLGEWTGPVASPYGVHILRVDARFAPQTPGFESVRSEVRDAWLADRRQAANAAFLAKLRERYRVRIAGTGS